MKTKLHSIIINNYVIILEHIVVVAVYSNNSIVIITDVKDATYRFNFQDKNEYNKCLDVLNKFITPVSDVFTTGAKNV